MPCANNKGTDLPAQSDQCHFCSLPRQYNPSNCYIRNFKPLASLCLSAGQFESYMVTNPEDRFSHDMAHISITTQVKILVHEDIQQKGCV